MSTKAEHARNIADKLYTRCGPGEHVTEAIILLREFAERLDAVAVSDAMVERAKLAWNNDCDKTCDERCCAFTQHMRVALESVLPIADEKAKDAERYRFWRKHYRSQFALKLPSVELETTS